MLVIIDYGMGNVGSVQKALKRIGAEAKVSSAEADIDSATRLILPGVGHFRNGMAQLNQLGLVNLLHKKVMVEKIPILGICLGMQLFTKHSEEGNIGGLGWIDAVTVKFKFDDSGAKKKIPHMGWNNINITKPHEVYNGTGDKEIYYFVHSYFVTCKQPKDILSTTVYGNEFVSSFQRDNIIGMQFHPEKSHSSGLKILKNFSTL